MAAGSTHGEFDKPFTAVPSIYVSHTHFTDEELLEFEDELERAGATLTYDVFEAGIILSRATKRSRLLFDLRSKGISIEEPPSQHQSQPNSLNAFSKQEDEIEIEKKASCDRTESVTRQMDEEDVITSSISQADQSRATRAGSGSTNHRVEEHRSSTAAKSISNSVEIQPQPHGHGPRSNDVIVVLRAEWAQQSISAGRALPIDEFEILSGPRRRAMTPDTASYTILGGNHTNTPPQQTDQSSSSMISPSQAILDRAREDAPTTVAYPARSLKRKFQGRTAPVPRGINIPSWAAGQSIANQTHLLHQTTSEEDVPSSSDLPEPPDWVRKGIKYACQRSTLSGSPNEEFVESLRKIKLARLLTSDEIGVRAYSTSIAAVLAYPYKFVHPREILQLPGCDAKIANLFVEYENTGSIRAVEEIEADHDLTVLRLFYNIWGVGSLTAREFYYDHGWQDLDDLVEYNWKRLSRVQQIGVKFYEEFLDSIPRAEVEQIGGIIHEHAVKVRDQNVQTMIVGGYRRGKAASGDVDVIVSHPDEEQTLDIVKDIVASLEDEGWITHTLLLSTNNSKRDQQTLPFRSGDMHGGHGFDSLDKALVVWQDPNWSTREHDLAADPHAKNKNIHRRVDIIIAPWRTVGCAVLGWSGGTTFQRDVRRYVKHLYGWKFDSSGVRDRGNGEVLDLEGYHRYDGKLGKGRAKTMLEAEKRVFEGLKLEYREPWERCTD